MIEDRERLKQESIQAALIYYELNPLARNYPVVRQLPLEREERLDYTYKFAVLVAGRAALVYRDWQGAYKVVDDPGRLLSEEEQVEKEAYQVLTQAAHYLDRDVSRVGRIEVEDVTSRLLPEAPYAARWLVSLDMESCSVVRADEPGGPHYSILES